ncbi:SET domain-containing protein 5 [Paraphaeosphaeria sporulosa]
MQDQFDLAKLSTPTAHTLTDARHLIEVRETPENGLGIFAKEKISRGTRIVAESPLLKATAVASHGVAVLPAFHNLSPTKQRAYLGLHGHPSEILKKDNDWESLPDLDRRVLAIYATNSWGRDVFWLASRFNHSCIPNIHNAYNPTIQMETFHSIRDVEAGEELTVSYLSDTCVRDKRQARLNKWGFQCKCPACQNTSNGNKMEQQLAQLATLSQELEMAIPGTIVSIKTLNTHRKMAALLRSVGLVGKPLHNSYLNAALCSAVLGNVQMAMLWTEKEVEVNVYCLGDDHPDCRKEAGVMNQLRGAAKRKKPFHYAHINWILDWDQGPN